ncbi:MAG: T9SS type A sorting domain-containing protein [Bacteroidales bacterium]|jgi:cyanophycinase-like exopeptidase|nr:T9SS type A sorting domain-containing protein [Bacteroidales bacterium]
MISKPIMNLILLFSMPLLGFGQTYTSYFTGNPVDTATYPQGGICLMGGASEDDNAMKWFLQRADGGDILVLRTSGADGYNEYMYSSLGISVNSVETIVFNSPQASSDPYIQMKIQQAEAIWFAGGDQWDYVSYWRDTPIDSLINTGIALRNIVTGGTSAGMAIQGKYYFTGKNGTVTSSTALANPYNIRVTVDSARFLLNRHLKDVITDTHYDNPDRKGRHIVFLARIFADYIYPARGIACDEYTAVCIDTVGIARVFGGYPSYDDNAYFIQTNCELSNMAPEACIAGTQLTWNLGGLALRVYRIKGTSTGASTFNLNDWKTGVGGNWLNWSVNSGVFTEQDGYPIDCGIQSADDFKRLSLVLYPNPSGHIIRITGINPKQKRCNVRIFNAGAQLVMDSDQILTGNELEINIGDYPAGIYLLKVEFPDGSYQNFKFLRKML